MTVTPPRKVNRRPKQKSRRAVIREIAFVYHLRSHDIYLSTSKASTPAIDCRDRRQ